jgi:serpin B
MSPSSRSGLESFAAAHNEFAIGLYDELRAGEGNLFFSPYNIRSALTLAYAGARGRNASQMAHVLRLPENDADLFRTCRDFEAALASRSKEGAIEIDTASALWRQKDLSLLAPYVDLIRGAFRSELLEADFAGSPATAGRIINGWVKRKTRGRIPDLFDPGSFDGLTRFILAAAIFFDGKWASAFAEFDTRPVPFWVPRSKSWGKVPMMRQEDVFRYANFGGFQALEMPYLGKEMSMVVLLPDAPDGCEDLEKELSAPELSRWFRALRSERVKVNLPKFQLDSSFRLDGSLGRMGMRDAFARSADFSGMTLEEPMGIGAMVHKAKVEVDEAGTKAAAASGILLCTGMMEELDFRADHPFLFVIRDVPMDAILFMGRVMEPEWSGNTTKAVEPQQSSSPGSATRSRRFFDRLLKTLGLK